MHKNPTIILLDCKFSLIIKFQVITLYVSMFIFIFLYLFHSSAALNIKRHLLSTLILSHVPWRGCIFLPTQYVTFFSFFLIVTVLFLNGLTKYLNHGFGLIFSLIYLKLTCRMFLFIMIMFAAVHIFSNAYWITNDIAFPFKFFFLFFHVHTFFVIDELAKAYNKLLNLES